MSALQALRLPPTPATAFPETCLQTYSALGSVLQASGLPLPPATVILPVTGSSATSQANWLAALGLRYGAELQFLFLVRSKADAAHDAVLALLAGDGSSRQVGRLDCFAEGSHHVALRAVAENFICCMPQVHQCAA